MKLIVGLGNPGPEYRRTRHNAGFMVVDALADRLAPGSVPRGRFAGLAIEARLPAAPSAGGWGPPPDDPPADAEPPDLKLLLLKPTQFMNLSGRSVAEAVRFYKLDPARDVLVVVDDVALPCGSVRLRPKGGAGGHNGLSDIARALGGEGWARCRVGIDPPGVIPQREYVLGRFTEEQLGRLEPALTRAADAAVLWARAGIDAAMNTHNAPAERPPRSEGGSADAGPSDEQTRAQPRGEGRSEP